MPRLKRLRERKLPCRRTMRPDKRAVLFTEIYEARSLRLGAGLFLSIRLSSKREFRREKKDEHTTASYADTGAPREGVAREDRGGFQRLPCGACRGQRRH